MDYYQERMMIQKNVPCSICASQGRACLGGRDQVQQRWGGAWHGFDISRSKSSVVVAANARSDGASYLGVHEDVKGEVLL